MSKTQTFKDDEIYIKTSDIDAIQHRPSMYISQVGEGGAGQICRELIDNSRDECIKKDSPGNEIYIELDEKHLFVKDNGRGIDTNLLQTVYETNQAGSSMLRSGGETVGENGSGTALAVAFAEKLVVTSCRPQEKKLITLEYHDGKIVNKKIDKYTGNDHGLSNYYEPSKKYLGTNRIPVEDLIEWLQDFDYTTNDGYKITYKVKSKTYKVEHKPLKKYIELHCMDPNSFATLPLEFSCKGKLDEVSMGKTYHRNFSLEAVLVYANPDYTDDLICKSWMNKINTIQHGSHLNGVLKGYQMFITEKCIKRNKKLEDEDLRKDILNHLHIVVNARCNLAHMFSGQTKYNCISPDLEKAIINATYEALCNNSSSKELVESFVDMVIGNHRARIAGEQSRNINKAVKDDKKWTQPKCFIPCSDVKCEFPREPYIVEGNSAGGGLRAARDARFHAIFQARGKILSVWNKSIEEILASPILRDLIKIMGCGVGPTFNMKKLKFDKIIIATDADIDGFQIRVLDSSIFAKLFPEIINAGKLFIAEPPLYRLEKGKKFFYVATQNEYIDVCIKSIGDIKISFPERNNICIDTKTFVHDTFDYLTTLRDVSIERNVNSQLMEYIAWGIANNKGDVNLFIKNINKWLKQVTPIYHEIGFDEDTHQISAVIDYHDQLIVVDQYLVESLRYIIDAIMKYGLLIEYSSKKLEKTASNTLSTFYVDIEKYYPTIKNRYKGLGQSPAAISKEVIMDPKSRRLIKLTMNDVTIMQQMSMLLAKDKESLLARKELIAGFNFTKNDIDN